VDLWPVITSIEPSSGRLGTVVTFTGHVTHNHIQFTKFSLVFFKRTFFKSQGRNFAPGMSIWLQTPSYVGNFTEINVQSSTIATAKSPGIMKATAERTRTSVVLSVPDPTLTPPSRTYVYIGGFTVLSYVQDPPNILDDGYAFMFGPYLALTVVIIVVGSLAIIVGVIICFVQLRRYLQGKLVHESKRSRSYSISS
jgi:hypothetical protein